MLSGIIKSMKAQILNPTSENFKFCAKVLRDGGLVAFPTGTQSSIQLISRNSVRIGSQCIEP